MNFNFIFFSFSIALDFIYSLLLFGPSLSSLSEDSLSSLSLPKSKSSSFSPNWALDPFFLFCCSSWSWKNFAWSRIFYLTSYLAATNVSEISFYYLFIFFLELNPPTSWTASVPAVFGYYDFFFIDLIKTILKNSLLMKSSIHDDHLKKGMFIYKARLYSSMVSIVQTVFIWGLLSLIAWQVRVKNSAMGSLLAK